MVRDNSVTLIPLPVLSVSGTSIPDQTTPSVCCLFLLLFPRSNGYTTQDVSFISSHSTSPEIHPTGPFRRDSSTVVFLLLLGRYFYPHSIFLCSTNKTLGYDYVNNLETVGRVRYSVDISGFSVRLWSSHLPSSSGSGTTDTPTVW